MCHVLKLRHKLFCLGVLFLGLGVVDSISRPLRIYCYDSVAVFVAKNNKSESWSKHIDIKNLAIKEHIKVYKVAIKHTNIMVMVVDPLTKLCHLNCLRNMCLN